MTTLKQVFCKPNKDEVLLFKSISELESLTHKDALWQECIIDATHFNDERYFYHGGTFASCEIIETIGLGLIQISPKQFLDLLHDRITEWRLTERGYDKHPTKVIYAKTISDGVSIVVDFEEKIPLVCLTVINKCMIPLLGIDDMNQLDIQEYFLTNISNT